MRLRLRELRKQKGLTQDQLAEMIGVSPSYLSEIETGRKTINARRIEAAAKALGVSPAQLLTNNNSDGETVEVVEIMKAGNAELRREILAFARFKATGQ